MIEDLLCCLDVRRFYDSVFEALVEVEFLNVFVRNVLKNLLDFLFFEVFWQIPDKKRDGFIELGVLDGLVNLNIVAEMLVFEMIGCQVEVDKLGSSWVFEFDEKHCLSLEHSQLETCKFDKMPPFLELLGEVLFDLFDLAEYF